MVSLKEIQKFIQELAKSDIVRLELKNEDLELSVQFKQEQKEVEANTEKIIIPQVAAPMPPATMAQTATTQQPVQPQPQPEQPQAKEDNKDDQLIEIRSPMVGTFYRRPAPDKPPYVEVGDQIKPGDVVCIIEAMKLFNEIESEVQGTIEKILVEDASPVEFDQPLFLVRPTK